MKILFLSSEAAPFAKSGGLGDVIAALPKALKNRHIEARVVLPLYKTIKKQYGSALKQAADFKVQLSWRRRSCKVFSLNHAGIEYYFVEGDDYFDRDGFYGFGDDAERFAFFSKASLDLLANIDYCPDVLHLSDWQTALAAVYLKTEYEGRLGYGDLKTIFTIHNIEYQGRFDCDILEDVLGLGEDAGYLLKHDDLVNYMKGGIMACDRLTTVSPTYAKQITTAEFGAGLDEIIKAESFKLSGILNGIDTELYDPATDPVLAEKYSAAQLAGKSACKKSLQKELGLDEEAGKPIVAMVTRLAYHKGIDLVVDKFDKILSLGVQFVLLGAGEWKYEEFFKGKIVEHPGKMAVHTGFDAGLANRIYAGADLFLMPSLTEPCGLSQMIAARYGTVPVVKKTGGLADSIRQYDLQTLEGNGFVFSGDDPEDMFDALKTAVNLFEDKDAFRNVIINAMRSDFSWDRGAANYSAVYADAAKQEDWQRTAQGTPDWLRDGIMYQIFPDRFNRSKKYKAPPLNKAHILREDWGGEPHKGPFPDGRWNEDFFGGNLKGIIEKLGYLKELGVTVIYLNPIFEAFSNHRYDTGNYLEIDPLLGTYEDFKDLCEQAAVNGMRIVLDGVFNHTGSDSLYFNKYGRYNSIGAYQSKKSPYYPWYTFLKYPDQYECWWGIEDLPSVNENNRDYVNYIAGAEDSVIRHWMKAGASGFRLDVVDELPDEFLDQLCCVIKDEKKDACIIGEVWEDASNKVAYGVRRRYFKGKQLDSVMNYPLKDALVSYLNIHHDGGKMHRRVKKLWENYPRAAFNSLMNLLSTHDTPRILTALSEGSIDREEATAKLRVAILVWALMPGIPCIYYGDELGYEGEKEPFNRRCFSMELENKEISGYYKEILAVRRGIPDIGELEYAPYFGEKGTFGFSRQDCNRKLIVVINAGEDYLLDLKLDADQQVEEHLIIRTEAVDIGKFLLKKWGGLVLTVASGSPENVD